MTAPFDNQAFGTAPPAPTGTKRAWAMLQALTTKTILAAGAVAIWQLAAPEAYKPATLLGQFTAAVVSNEVNGSADAHVALQRRMNDLNAEMQVRIFTAQQIALQRLRTLDGQTAMAQLADMACIGSMIVGGIAGAYHDNATQAGAQKFMQGTCGIGGAVRNAMSETMVQISKGVVTEAAAGFDGHHYSQADLGTLAAYAQTLPPDVRRRFAADNAPDDVIADRIMIYFHDHNQD